MWVKDEISVMVMLTVYGGWRFAVVRVFGMDQNVVETVVFTEC